MDGGNQNRKIKVIRKVVTMVMLIIRKSSYKEWSNITCNWSRYWITTSVQNTSFYLFCIFDEQWKWIHAPCFKLFWCTNHESDLHSAVNETNYVYLHGNCPRNQNNVNQLHYSRLLLLIFVSKHEGNKLWYDM